jgi:hypothetical protein
MKKAPQEQLTREILDRIPDDQLDDTILTRVGAVIGDLSKEYEIVKMMSSGIQMMYSTCYLEYEVCNGGFSQYFLNSASQFAAEALEGYRLIGADEVADLVEKAIHEFKTYEYQVNQVKDLRDSAYRQWVHDSEQGSGDADGLTVLPNVPDGSPQYKQALEGLNDLFYSVYSDAESLRAKYVREYPEEFLV